MFEVMVVGQIGGFAILLGVFVLLFKRIVVLDAETRQPTSFEFPLLGKVKTQTPLLVPILLSAALIVFPVTVSGRLEVPSKPLKGTIMGRVDQPMVLIVGQPDFIASADEEGRFSTYIPLLKKKMTYHVLVLESKQQIGSVIIDDSKDWGNIKIVVQKPAGSGPPSGLPKKEFVITPAAD